VLRSLALVLALSLAACPSDPGPETQGGSSGGSTAADGSTGGTGSTGEATTSPTTSGATSGDATCPARPTGQWAACEKNGVVDKSVCGWTDSGQNGELTCLSPASGGGYNVCAIKGCVDDCDCFAAPASGDAVVFCAELGGGGEKACTLYCAGGQTCPDGMSCQGGYCFWDG
jgi:hypothetical protein